MADIRIRELPTASPAVATDFVAIDNGSTRKVAIGELVDAGRPLASQAEAEAGTDPAKAMTPLTTAQAIAAQGGTLFASAAQGLLASTALQPAAIGTTVQPLSSNLSTLAGLSLGAAGLSILQGSTQADVRGFLDIPVYVEDRTALRALDTTKDTVAYLKETGREGEFTWISGDYSARITSDPQEGLYIKADAIAATAGAWVRQGGWAVSGVKAEWFGAVGDGNRLTGTGTVNDTALQAVMNLPYNIILGQGIYRVTHPLINRIEERLIIGQGRGYIWGEASRANFSAPTIILATGTASKRVMTRRKNRYSAGDANDAAMSAVVDNEAAGARFRDFAIELYCDYTNTSPTNYGHDWDIGFFNGCRAHVEANLLVLGYFRKASFYFDVTRGTGIPELRDYDGNALPVGSDGLSGSDGIRMFDVQCVGGRVGRAILGVAVGRTGAAYYDAVTGTTYTDNRGLSGCSDLRSERGTIASVNHHSGYRAADPIGFGAALTRANMELEDDFAPAAQYIDGYAGNAASTTLGLGAIRGMVFNDFRFLSIEMFRIRHGQCDEITYEPRTWAEAGFEGTIRSTAGTVITVSDYVNNTYGPANAEHSTYTQHVHMDAPTGGASQPWATVRFTCTDAAGRIRAKHFESLRFTLADDTVQTITPPFTGGRMSLTLGPTSTGPQRARSGVVFYDVGSSLDIAQETASANFSVGTTDLTNGTGDGVDGNTNVHVQSGVIKVKNRAGGTAEFGVTFYH